MTAATAPQRGPQPAAHNNPGLSLADPGAAERAAQYAAMWGDATGYTYVVGGLPGDDILARGWPLAPDESSDPDKVMILSYTRATFDTFKAAGRPHTGKVFAWPSQARALDSYVRRLDREGYNVYTRKYLAETAAAAKHGDAPTKADRVWVEDAPEAPAELAPAYSAVLQTSDYSRQAIYQLARPLPWSHVAALAEAAAQRLGADSGGKNPAQFTRIATTRNTKRKAARFKVRFVAGAGTVDPSDLARAVGCDLGRASSITRASGERKPSNGKGGPGADDAAWCAVVEAAQGWRGYLWKDGELRKGGPLLREDGTPRVLKPEHYICRVLRGELPWKQAAAEWGGKDPSGSGFTYHLVGALWCHRCELPQIVAMVEALDPAARGKGDAWFYHQDLWGCLYRQTGERRGWALLLPDIPRRPLRTFTPQPVEIPEAPARRRRGRPAGAQHAHREAVAAALAERLGHHTTRAAIAAAVRLTPRSITTHMQALASAGRLDLMPDRRGFTVVRVENKSPLAAPPPAIADVPHPDAAEAPEGVKVIQAPEGGNIAGFSASQSGADLQEDHAPPSAMLVAAPEPEPTPRPLTPRALRALVCDALDAYQLEVEPTAADVAEALGNQRLVARLRAAELRRLRRKAVQKHQRLLRTRPDAPPVQPAAPRPDLELATAHLQRALSRKLGRLYRRYIAANGGAGCAKDDVTGALRVEQLRRGMATWKRSDLRARLRQVEALADRAREQGSGSAEWFDFEASLLRDEMRRRPSTRQKPRPVCEALPDLRQLGERHQQRLLRDAARELEVWRRERAPAAQQAGRAGVAPQTPPPEAPAAAVEPEPLDPLRYAWAMGHWSKIHRAAAERGLTYDALVAMLTRETPLAAPAAACE